VVFGNWYLCLKSVKQFCTKCNSSLQILAFKGVCHSLELSSPGILPTSSVGLRLFWLCTRSKFVARGQALNTTH
jgi:hypothetical protein